MTGESDPRIADTLDETCHGLREIVDRVDDGEAENHLKLAISHLEHVARWDRDERGETPTDALRDFVTDGGVDQSDGETDHSRARRYGSRRSGPSRSTGDDLPDGFLDDEEENEAIRRCHSNRRRRRLPRANSVRRRRSATNQRRDTAPRDSFRRPLQESDDDVYYAVTEDGVRLYCRVTGNTTIVRGLLAYDAVIHAGGGSRVSRRPRTTSSTRRSTCITMGGRKASFRADRILDEPVITLAEANRV